jgi:hypothetical protein
MELELNEAVSIVRLAKKLYDINRGDIVKNCFHDVLCCDAYYENMINMIESIFATYHGNYKDDDYNYMVFIDDVISDYYCMAWEYGKRNKLPDKKNPYIIRAAEAVRNHLYFSYSLDWQLLGYAQSRKAAQKSRLIVYTCAYEFCEHDELAHRLITIYEWFMQNSAEYRAAKKEEVLAA